MKIMDEKGRVFGKINLIDLLVILFFLCLLPGVYFGLKTLTKEEPVEVVASKKIYKEIEIEIDCLLTRLTPENIKIMTVGDKEIDLSGNVIGEIVKLGEVSDFYNYEYLFDIGQKQTIAKVAPILKQRKVRLRVKAELREQNLYYNNVLIKIDSPFSFSTSGYSAMAIPEGDEVMIVVKFRSVIPELAELISAGDQWVVYRADKSKKVLAEITRVVSNEPAEILQKKNGADELVLLNHPQFKDVVVEIKVLCTLDKDSLYCNGNPIRVGALFEFINKDYELQLQSAGLILEVAND